MAGQYTGVGTCSDATGRYTLAGLPTGQYKIAFYPPGSGSTSPYWYLQRSNELSATPITITGLQTTALQDEILTIADDSTPTRSGHERHNDAPPIAPFTSAGRIRLTETSRA